MRKHQHILSLAALAMTVAGGSAYAQTTPAPSAGDTLQEVVVTANKRSENLQDVPVAINAVTAETLAQTGVTTTQDLIFITPALVYSRTGAYAQPFLRGIGSDLTIPNADPSVTTYIDGVVVSTTASLIQDLLGIQRVEIAEGPQGTLNGRNATAGAISIYTLTPTQQTDADVKALFGSYDSKQLSAHLSGGVTDQLAVGIYVGLDDRHTYLTQLGNALAPPSERSVGGRIKAVYTPTDTVTITGSIEYTESRSLEAGSFRNVQVPNLGSALAVPNAAQPPYTINTGPDNYSGSTRVDNQDFAAMLREEADFGWSRLLGITGYRSFKSIQGNDLDGTPLAIVDAVSLPARSKQLSQEAQLISPDSSKIKWIAGLYFLHESAGLEPVGILSDFILPPPFDGSWDNTVVVLNSYAAFAQVTVPLVDRLNLTLGGRYTVDKKTWNAVSWLTTGPDYTFVPATLAGYPEDYHKFDNFTPKATLDYKFDNETMVYATFARGYKAGAFNVSVPTDREPINPEKLDDYELGIKSQFLDDRLRINGSAYYYDYSNIQVNAITGGGGGVAETIQNAAAAKLYGVEASANGVITSSLHANASLSWEHTRFSSFPNDASFNLSPAGNGTALFNATGNQLPRAPKWAGTVGGDYDHELIGGDINLAANLLYNGGFFWEETNRFRQGAYAILNAQAAYTFPDHHLKIMISGTNLTNRYYADAFQILPTAIGVNDAPPRMYNGGFEWKW